MRFGHIDALVPRAELRAYVARLLRLFTNGSNGEQ
jgi:acetyl-CoA carboxylase beta subunit